MSSATRTKDRLLSVAEELFAEHGFERTSMRTLTTAAGANLAAVNYHFGSKEGLYRAVFERRVGPINQERLRLLAEAQAAAGDDPVPIEVLLEALLGPPLRLSARGDEGFLRFLRIVARMQSSSGEHAFAVRDVFQEVQRRFFPALHRCLPHLEERDLFWRMHLIIGGMLTLFGDPARLGVFSDGRCDGRDADEALAQLVAFARGALEAPPAASPASAPTKVETA